MGVPVPPGPLPRKPTALMLGKQVQIHDQKDVLYQYMALAESHSPMTVNKTVTKGKGKKDKDGTLPNIEQNLLTSPSKGGVLIPEFTDAADAIGRGERGFSAFTRSQNMDIDT